MLEASVFERCAARSVLSGFGARTSAHPRSAAFNRKMMDPALQLEDMDARGIGTSVVSSGTVIETTSWAEPREELALVRRLNDTIATWVRDHPARFAGSFTLPLQDLDLALGELVRAVDELGLRIVNAPARVGDDYLGAQRFRPFWEAVHARDLVVFIHPEGTKDAWFQQFALWNSLGQSIEEAKVMASLIYEGTFDAFPGVKIVMSHGGGYFPHYMGRMDRNVTMQPETMQKISRKPSEYLRSFFYDTCVYDRTAFEALVRIVGPERIVLGSDYPVGDADPVGFVAESSLADADVRAIVAENAAALLGITAEVGTP
jgi:aminocarboxymuconate-semialdehyde decarboxylase